MAKIHEVLTDPTQWTQGYMRRDGQGNGTWVEGPEIASRCLVGWVDHVYGYGKRPDYVGKIAEAVRPGANLTELYKEMAVTAWNDHPERTFDEVRGLCRKLDI